MMESVLGTITTETDWTGVNTGSTFNPLKMLMLFSVILLWGIHFEVSVLFLSGSEHRNGIEQMTPGQNLTWSWPLWFVLYQVTHMGTPASTRGLTDIKPDSKTLTSSSCILTSASTDFFIPVTCSGFLFFLFFFQL